jgi:hypothetical protein
MRAVDLEYWYQHDMFMSGPGRPHADAFEGEPEERLLLCIGKGEGLEAAKDYRI